MGLFQSFKSLSPQTRLYVGAGFIAWGLVGLYISDKAEKKLGLEATEKDREELKAYVPKISTVEKDEFR